MKLIIATIIIVTLGTCGTKEEAHVLKGDLYFSWIRLGSYYNLSDSMIAKFESHLDTVNLQTTDKSTRELVTIYKALKERNMMYKPFVDILVNKDSTIKLYLDSVDYDQIKIYKLQELQDTNKKVSIEAMATEIAKGFYYCVDLSKVGTCRWRDISKKWEKAKNRGL